MPVDGAQLTLKRTWFTSKPRHTLTAVGQGHQAAQQVQPVHAGEQVKESDGRVVRQEVTCSVQLLPRQELPDQECKAKTPPAIRPYPTPSICPLRPQPVPIATRHCSRSARPC